jgi:hypothetical protein
MLVGAMVLAMSTLSGPDPTARYAASVLLVVLGGGAVKLIKARTPSSATVGRAVTGVR